ncbi:MAG: zinc ABC transporter substrate-binding protein [Spirochaetaceae bacterium]|nr:zinc ABC transporter substrate-binding protein [Spirochaetaceae bacterium]
MMRKRTVLMLLLLVASVLPLALFAQQSGQSSSWPLRIAVSIPPMQEFVQRLAGKEAEVTVVLPPGASPHAFEPTPQQLASIGKAQVWFLIGVEFEKPLVPKVARLYPKLRIVDVSRQVKFRLLSGEEQEFEGDHDHKEQTGEGKQGALDPHTWLGPDAVKAEIAVILETLRSMDPPRAALYSQRHQAYVKDIDAAFDSLRRKLAPYRGRPVYVYHPSFGYFLDAFGLIQKPVELGGKEPTPKALSALIARAKADGARVIFVQTQFSQAAARTVAAAIGGSVVPMDPLAPDWLANIERMGQAIAAAFSTAPGTP